MQLLATFRPCSWVHTYTQLLTMCRCIQRSLPILGNLLKAGNADTVREAITLLTMLKKVGPAVDCVH